IYRPHPAENISEGVYKMAEKFPNFVINKDFSIRQWIRIVDSISLWYSTSIADIAYCKKKCMILRPYEYPDDIDEIVLRGGKYIKSFEIFKEYMENPKDIEFPIDEKIIHYYFGDDFDGKSYMRLADICEKVINSPREVDYAKMISVKKDYPLKVTLIKVFCSICSYINLTWILPVKYKEYFRRLYIEQKNYKMIFNEYCKRLEKII
ncbi:hypothetical protein, partial [Schaedlerella arabinosiphila]